MKERGERKEIKKGNINVHATSIKYRIPKSTLYDHINVKVKKIIAGHPTVLSYEEEKEIAYTCEILQVMAFPLNRETVTMVVQNYIYPRQNVQIHFLTAYLEMLGGEVLFIDGLP